MSFSSWSDNAFDTAREIPLTEARINASDPRVEAAVKRLGSFDIPIHLVAHEATHPATDTLLEGWIADLGDYIACWEFEVTGDLSEVNRLIRTLHRLRPQTEVAIRVNTPEDLEKFLDSPDWPLISRVVITQASADPNQQHRFHVIAELAGLENVELAFDYGKEDSEIAWKQILARMTPLSSETVDIPQVEFDTVDDLKRISTYNQWAEMFAQLQPVGPIYIHNEIDAYLFRDNRPDMPWVMALTSDSKSTLVLPPEFSHAAYFSGAAAPAAQAIESLALDSLPTLISGSDSTTISKALCNALALDAGLLLKVKSYTSSFNPSLRKSLEFLKACTPDDSFRDAFFVLVRQFPDLESSYRSDELPAHIVIPVTVRLTSPGSSARLSKKPTTHFSNLSKTH